MALAVLSLIPSSTQAQTGAPVEITGVRVGFDGLYKVGAWTPVEVRFRSRDPQLQGRIAVDVVDCDDVASRFVTPRPVLGSEGSALLYVKIGKVESGLTVRFLPEGGRPVVRRFDAQLSPDEDEIVPALLSDQELWVNYGPSVGLEDARRLNRRAGYEGINIARLEDAATLPTRWYGYDGVDVLVLTTSGADAYDALQEGSARLEAIDRWVSIGGGTLILFCGQNAQKLMSPGQPLARFSPGELASQPAELTQSSEFERYVETSETLNLGRGLPAPRLEEVRGKVEVQQRDVPIVVRTPRGFGQVVFVAADFDSPPLVDWGARDQFLNRLLGKSIAGERGGEEDEIGGRLASTGITDMAGQIRYALEQFEGIRLVPFSIIALLVLGYILLIGPIDFFLVKRVLGRMELTWITFPLFVIAVSAGAYYLAKSTKGDQRRVNQIDLVDVDMASNTQRGFTWLKVFSPEMQFYDVSLTPPQGGAEAEPAKMLTSWLGLPGSALGGMDSNTPTELFRGAYRFSPELDHLSDVPIQVWSTKSFETRWSRPSTMRIETDILLPSTNIPEGTLTNTLDVPLENCFLAVAESAYEIESLQPGETVSLGDLTRRDLRNQLTGSRIAFDENTEQYRPHFDRYNPQSTDVPYILRQMLFFTAGGGRDYTTLVNRYQHFTDLSEHLKLGRGILIGFVPVEDDGNSRQEYGATLNLDDQAYTFSANDKHWVCYRFVFPINADNQ